jgi:hypothetical protein
MTPFNAFPYGQSKPQEAPSSSWWVADPAEFAQRQRLEQQRMSASSLTIYPKADGEHE